MRMTVALVIRLLCACFALSSCGEYNCHVARAILGQTPDEIADACDNGAWSR